MDLVQVKFTTASFVSACIRVLVVYTFDSHKPVSAYACHLITSQRDAIFDMVLTLEYIIALYFDDIKVFFRFETYKEIS